MYYLDGVKSVISEAVEIANNKATYGAGITQFSELTIMDKVNIHDNNANYGGAIYAFSLPATESAVATNADLTIRNNVTLSGNTATAHGGAIYAAYNNITIGENTKFSGNIANNGEGGAIYAAYSNISIGKNTTFSDNKAKGEGGAIKLFGNLNADEVTFQGNISETANGGAISVGHNASATFNNSKFIGNKAFAAGAIFQDYRNSNLVINNSEFTKNEADVYGAVGIHSKATITNSTFAENKATNAEGEGAGALFLGSVSETTISNTKFLNNTSASNGGAIGTRVLTNANGTTNDNSKATLDIIGSTFENNHADKDGGAIYNTFYNSNNNNGAISIINTTFKNNNAGNNGGAINNSDSGNLSIIGSVFQGNTAVRKGGAIYNAAGSTTTIGDNAAFIENAANDGGAIYNEGTLKIGHNAVFIDNKVFEYSPDGYGNEIYNKQGDITFGDNLYIGRKEVPDYYDCSIWSNGGSIKIGNNATFEKIVEPIVTTGGTILEIGDNAHFIGNVHGIDLWSSGDSYIGKNIVFENHSGRTITTEHNTFANTLTIDDGAIFRNNHNTHGNPNTTFGIIFNGSKGSIHFLGSADFLNNSTPQNKAGVIQNWYKLTFDGDTNFVNNSANGDAGALLNRGENSDTVFNSTVKFIENKASGNGGAIYNQGKLTFNDTSIFAGNSSEGSGGAIYSETELTIADGTFVNNSAGDKGGAIFANDNLTISAVANDVIFSGNKAADGGDIYMNTAGSTLAINLDNEKVVTIQDGISGNDGKYNIAINGFGDVNLQSYIKNANVTVDTASLYLGEGSRVNGLNNSIIMNNNSELVTVNNKLETFDEGLFTLNGDVDLAVDVDLATGNTDFFKNAISDTSTGKFILEGVKPIAGNATKNSVQINLYEALGLDASQLQINPDEFVAMKALTPIRYLTGSVSENGILTYLPTGNSYKDFNPAVMASPVAAQLGGYLTQLNSYDQAFRNMDMYMLMTKKQREAIKLRNKYAVADSNLVFDPTGSIYDDRAGWVRPYATFENVPLKGGPRVSNVAYGSYFGVDSEMYELGNGWDGMVSFYAGYNGSHQAYDGVGIYQNGGTLGAVGMAYKGNFFTGLTINAGANGGEASTMYGNDNFSMIMAGIASKTGYNWELADGKFIIQPNFLMSYSFVNTFDYTNAAGVRINSDPLNAIQIEPGLKFIGNLKNGWQPYLGVSMVWNIMDKTDFRANDVALPDLSVKPYVKYGIGVRKVWGERFSGYGQTYFTNGGRNGVGLQFGFRWTLGKGQNSINTGNKTPERPKTEIKLSNLR